MASERVLLNRPAFFSNLYSTNFNIILDKIFFGIFQALKWLELDLSKSSLIAKHLKLFKNFHFLTALRSIGYVENFVNSKCTCAPYDGAYIIFL